MTRLALHQLQRDQSIPTLSVFLGKAIAARQAWTQWLCTTRRSTTVCAYQSPLALFAPWFVALAQEHDLQSLVFQKVASQVGQAADQLAMWFANASAYQRQLFWQQLYPATDDLGIMQALVTALVRPTKSIHLAGRLFTPEEPAAVLQNFAVVARLVPPSTVPGLLVLLPEDGDHALHRRALTFLTQLAETIPHLPVGLILSADQGAWLQQQLPASRVKAMLRSGLLTLPAADGHQIRQWLGEHGITDTAHHQTILHLAERHGMTTETLATAVTLTAQADQVDSAAADMLYRSQAEKFLFQYLEARPTTVGRFQVNARLDIAFGDRPMEVDFLDEAAKVVIELDGHYHFTSLDSYRRDRRKDRLLQQHGFLVLRFLAADVVGSLEEIFAAVDQALTLRQSNTIHRLET
ncbi:MAG: DUF559 domain-containing protein [Caldilineaceae bacterium]|nr:DUF559 domain-containing protein [Caldilineaceae bacterium]